MGSRSSVASSDAGAAASKALPSIRRVGRSQQVREQIEAAIVRGDFAPGDRLPSERQLGEMIGVSRVSVREAIRSLEAVGLVEVYQGRGCFVTRGPGGGYASSFGHWLAVHRDEVMDLLNVRRALDSLAAEVAARHADDERCAALQRLNRAFIEAQAADPYDLSAVVAADKAFHGAVAEASGSRLLATLLGEVGDQIDDSRRILLADRGRAQSSAREHQLVVDAILAHDPPAARSAAGFHIDRVCAFVAELVEGGGRRGSDTPG